MSTLIHASKECRTIAHRLSLRLTYSFRAYNFRRICELKGGVRRSRVVYTPMPISFSVISVRDFGIRAKCRIAFLLLADPKEFAEYSDIQSIRYTEELKMAAPGAFGLLLLLCAVQLLFCGGQNSKSSGSCSYFGKYLLNYLVKNCCND